jgi:hypothetical protein
MNLGHTTLSDGVENDRDGVQAVRLTGLPFFFHYPYLLTTTVLRIHLATFGLTTVCRLFFFSFLFSYLAQYLFLNFWKLILLFFFRLVRRRRRRTGRFAKGHNLLHGLEQHFPET